MPKCQTRLDLTSGQTTFRLKPWNLFNFFKILISDEGPIPVSAGSVLDRTGITGCFDANAKEGYIWFLAATKQLYEWYFLSVCPSVRPSVRLSHLFDYVPIIVSSWNFQELSHWTRVRSMQKVKVKGQGHRGHDPNFRFRTVTPVWIHIWWWNDTYNLMLLRRGALLFFKVTRR